MCNHLEVASRPFGRLAHDLEVDHAQGRVVWEVVERWPRHGDESQCRSLRGTLRQGELLPRVWASRGRERLPGGENTRVSPGIEGRHRLLMVSAGPKQDHIFRVERKRSWSESQADCS